MKTIRTAAKVLLVMTVLTGILYPLAITGLAQLLFPGHASGSLVSRNGHLAGSTLVGQRFVSDKYFWPRPSATDYGAMPSSGSNLGPTSDTLKKLIETRRSQLQATPHEMGQRFPWEMACASASGLDPDISPEAARYQVARIVSARGLDSTGATALQELIETHVEQPSLGIFGETRVNVFRLNLALDSLVEARK